MIDVTKCIGCRKGTSLFFEKDGEYIHVDLFATPESGSACKCENSETIGNFLMKNGDRGTFIPNEQSKEFFNNQIELIKNIKNQKTKKNKSVKNKTRKNR